MGEVIRIDSQEEWTAQLAEANSSKKLVVIFFTATWCGPCRLISPVVIDLAKKHTNVTFLKVDVDEMTSIAEDLSVQAMPTFVFMKEGKVVDKLVGPSKDWLANKIEEHTIA